jgi:hypothetical protein
MINIAAPFESNIRLDFGDTISVIWRPLVTTPVTAGQNVHRLQQTKPDEKK